jgi:hypothetical protein
MRMDMKKVMVVVLASVLLSVPVVWADNAIFGVPDWNQPNNYNPPGAGYPGWCAPTTGANIMGYWEDNYGGVLVGLTDRQAFNATPAYAGNAGTWMQGLWHDGSVEMGWFMDTGGWATAGGPFPPNAGNTGLAKIGPGMFGYATVAWVDPGSGISKSAVAPGRITQSIDTTANPGIAQMWLNYMAEIDAGHPVAATFQHWVALPFLQTVQVNVGGQMITVEQYTWNTNVEEHTVAGVGYIDPNPAQYDNDGSEWFITHDTWPGPGGPNGTGLWVAVPVDSNWLQNDYIQFDASTGAVIPESAGAAVLLLGLPLLAWRRRRK